MTLSRFEVIDVWRGLAVVGMIVFHFFWIFDFFGFFELVLDEGLFLFLARFVQISFLFLVGMSLSFSFSRSSSGFYQRQVLRFGVVLACAALVSLVSWFVFGEAMVVFGILHLIAMGILFLFRLVPYPRMSLVLGLLFFVLAPVFHAQEPPLGWLIVFGFSDPSFVSVDYFPLFPWFGFMAVGVWLGSVFFPLLQSFQLPQCRFSSPLVWMGNRSLMIYLIHLPVLYGFALLISLWR